MFGSAFDKVTGLLAPRFVLGLVMPVLAFSTGIGALLATRIGWTVALSWWAGLDGSRRTLLVIAFVTTLVVVATFLGTRVVALTRVLEGYWGPRVQRLTIWSAKRQKARLESREHDPSPVKDLRLYRGFPYDEDLLPTRLGNALRAAERYPGDDERWSLDAVFWWPRLCLVLPDQARDAVDSTRATLDQLIVLTWLAVAFAVASAGFGIWGLPLVVWLPCTGGSLLLARAAYVSAVSAAEEFGEQVRSCFDLYRKPLLEALGWPDPDSWDDERALWRALGQQLYRRGTDRPELLSAPRRTVEPSQTEPGDKH